jgi:hypothetical protein
MLRSTLSLLLLLAAPVFAQDKPKAPADDELFRTVAAHDKAVFDAYNACDLDKLASYFAEDLEFYHDQGGLSRGRQALVDGVKNNICGKVRRELVTGTLEVHPMKNYGAVEMGVHRFHHPGHEATEGVGEASFVHLWQNTNGAWKITRVISYDHHSLEKPASK